MAPHTLFRDPDIPSRKRSDTVDKGSMECSLIRIEYLEYARSNTSTIAWGTWV